MKIRLLCEETWRFSGSEREIGKAKHADFFSRSSPYFLDFFSFNLRKFSPILLLSEQRYTRVSRLKKHFSDTI